VALSTGHSRLSSRLLLAGSVLIPAALFLGAAWLDYQATLTRAREYLVTTTNALADQTAEALQTAGVILARVLDRVDGMDWQSIDKSREVHDFLAKIDQELPLVQSVFLVDPAGYNSASSRAFPMIPYDLRDREYYIEARKGDDRLYVTAAFFGQMTGVAGFTVSRPRLTNGHFDGVVVVTLSPAYFQNFYERITLSPTHATAALVRADGKILVRYPDIKSVGQLPANSSLLAAARSGAEAGVFFGTSTLDGIANLAAFRRVENQPLLANFTLADSYYLGQWYTDLIWMGAFALLTALALGSTSLVVLRQASLQEAHLRLLLQESERRKEAEDVVQHLQRMEALGRLSGGVAHDFNNLLAAIMGALELATRRISDPVRLQPLIAVAMQAAERGARLTGQMLAFSRNKDIAPHPLDINGIIRESDTLIQRTVEALIEVGYSLEESLWPAIADRVQFEVAILNLAGNARDAMPLGGRLTFVTRNVSVIAADAPGIAAGDYVQVSVTDTGEGMSKETLARAFDPFFTTKGVGKGTGLGLSQVYGFAQQLGGTVRIDTAIGLGTTVTIWLPRAHAAAVEEPVGPVAIDREPSAPVRILLVDDDQAVRLLTVEMLSELGHTVASAESGVAALAMLSTEAEFDLLLSDFAMPVMNGAQLAAEAMKLRPQLPVLFMTGYADTTVLKSWTELGYRTLNKPFSSEELDVSIRQTIKARAPAANVVRLVPHAGSPRRPG
jgi:signal transduction histidine kinase/ActR/RegA family two-component response regulator